ncbi:hypothetical protein ACIBKX_37810 [Streptomyces sp. NPDC050658]|uniref:hypothetical protein n=1 Tax=unclassified Streptomyces TaxID=2593676 RepID=UPI003430352A
MVLTIVIIAIAADSVCYARAVVAKEWPTMDSRPAIATLAIFTALLTASLLMIRDVDRPYQGLIKVDSISMTVTSQDISADFASAYGEGKLPCDEQGQKA